MRRRRVLGYGAAALALGLGIAAQELVVRLAVPEFDPSRQVHYTDKVGDTPILAAPGLHRQAKNTGDYNVVVRINRHGFRDGRDIAEATGDDWIVVGDSYAFGWGVEARDRTSEQLEKRLGGPRVFNIAMTGNFDDYGQLLRHAARLGATVRNVAVMVTMENDLGLYGPAAPGQQAASSESDWNFLLFKNWLMAHSELYYLATSMVHHTEALRDLAVRAGMVRANLDGVHKAEENAEVPLRSANRLAEVLRDYPQSRAVIIPSRALWAGSAEDRATADRVHRAFVAALAAHGVRVIDMRPDFEAGGAPLSFHFAHDGHWNPRGHALAAERLACSIRSCPP
ncbi:SGNH/GDSL hydrolase family protein [Paramagnetospirillum kuznetsovii]|uniref:SGNH/GDSL hydrolase family protein n=1 Tax=Paramagnetospirillum kuznetsovii TaxID=2053833 RepID=UPI001374C44A|nr:SGNH/GDSL hydrolase family protein [Paramagnetospirillum kuznetsovii]